MATLNTNIKGDTAATLTLTTETVVTLYVLADTGGSGNYRVGLELSPDNGATWLDSEVIISGPDIETITCAATKARAVTLEAQGSSSTVTIHLLAR